MSDVLGDVLGKGKEFLEQNSQGLGDALKSDQAEQISDQVLDGVAGLAKKAAPGAADQIDGIRDSIDKVIGNE